MQVTRDFTANGDRYRYDFRECSAKRGWAQVDTSRDAWYFGTWANPTRLAILTYAEGDITLQQAETAEEFAAELRHVKAWNDEQGREFYGIDPGLGQSIRAAFEALGLGDLLH